ncbi:hypothetical protein CN514_10520 [Bacillus sp. AFS001701]|nr:hypothetical protein CN514_10520 [Bacillus sp. AFS001701]
MHGIEITFTLQGADEVIKELADLYKDSNQVVIGAGAQFIVSPAFDEETAKLCNLYQVPYMPGCITITEMKHALEAGVDIVKLFPGSAFGPDFVKAVKAPLPQVNIMPTGGVMVNQVEFHPHLTQKELLAFCKNEGIQMEAWSPLKQGQLLEEPVLTKIAQKYNKSVAQVILRWDLQHDVVTIPKSIKEHRIVENANIFDFELTQEDMENIDSLNQDSRAGSHPDTMRVGF